MKITFTFIKERFDKADDEFFEYCEWSDEIAPTVSSVLSFLIDMDDENEVEKLASLWFDWSTILFREDFKQSWLEKYFDIINWDQVLYAAYYLGKDKERKKKFKSRVDQVYSVVLRNLDRIDECYWVSVSDYVPLEPEVVQKYIDKVTEEIFNNPNYETYPTSLKLLLKQKFDK